MTDVATKPPAAENLSAQDRAIEAGNLIVHGSATDRVLGLDEAIAGYGRPRVTLDRAVLFTEPFRETEHEPLQHLAHPGRELERADGAAA